MCGRFALVATSNELEEEFSVSGISSVARYNIAPNQEIILIAQDGDQRFVRVGVWGFRRHDGGLLINVRSETALERPHIRRLLDSARCIVPASGFYEWAERGRPFFLHTDTPLIGFAGIVIREYDSSTGKHVLRTSILTRAADPSIMHLHERMPVVIPRALYHEWLSPQTNGETMLSRVLTAEHLTWHWYPVSPRVGNVANDDPSLVMPIEDTSQ
jgi:putative SOS response-associated peptidase YedK